MRQVAVFLFVVFAASIAFTDMAGAQGASSSPAAAVAQASPAPAVAQPVVAPAAVSPALSQPLVAVPAVAAPPSWATDLLTTVGSLPVVGPYVSKFLLWLGILAAILTTLVAAALSILASLKGAFAYTGFDKAAQAIASFQSGPIMYWLTYFSNFNAKKPTA